MGTLSAKSANSSGAGRFQSGGGCNARCALHLPILGELETVYQKPSVARGVFAKVADRFFKNTPGPKGFLGF